MRTSATTAGAAVVVLALMAPGVSAYPSRVENSYKVTTTGGTCDVTVVASATPGVAVANGALTGIESVNCSALTFTPYYIHLDGWFSGTSLDPLHVLYSDETFRHCERQKSCYKSRSKIWFPPGDHYVTHDVTIDVAPYAVADTFLSFPQQCRVSSSDRGRLICGFTQWVTMPTPAGG
jgi:hypothetical protein